MKKILIVLFSIALFAGCTQKPEPQSLVEQMSTQVEGMKSAHLTWEYMVKGLLQTDTSKMKVEAWLEENENDSVYGAKILVHYPQDSTWAIFYNNQGYIYNSKKNTLTHYPVKYARYAVTGDGSKLFEYLLNPKDLKKIFSDSLNKVTVKDTVINNKQLWQVTVLLPDDEDYTQRKSIYYFDKNTKMLTGYYREIYVISDWYIEAAMADSITINSVPDKFIDNFFAKVKDSAENKELPVGDENGFELLPKAQKAPDIKGTYYGTDKEFSLYEQNAKVYVIDFWYQSCRPCMLAVPYLVDLYNKYKDQGLMVIGVNSVDNNDQRRPYIKKFIEYKKVDYPIIMVDRTIDKMYKVPGYPTVYVLDANKKIIGYEVGFDPATKLDKIEEMVEKALSE